MDNSENQIRKEELLVELYESLERSNRAIVNVNPEAFQREMSIQKELRFDFEETAHVS